MQNCLHFNHLKLNSNPPFPFVLSLISINILLGTALFMVFRSHDLQAKKHSFQPLDPDFQPSISPSFILSISQCFIGISFVYAFKITWYLVEKHIYLDAKYWVPYLNFSLFSFPNTIHDTPPGTSPPSAS